MHATATAGEAFHVLASHGISGAPVVDAAGVVVANVSVSDMRRLAHTTNHADTDAALAKPVLEFLRGGPAGAGRAADPVVTSTEPVVVHAGDSVGMVVQLLAESRLHHVYVVDGARRPVGVLALADVLRALVWCVDG